MWYGLMFVSIIISALAQAKISSAYRKYSKRPILNGYTGAQVARLILDRSGLSHVPVVPIAGRLTDNYNPKDRTVYLSQDIFQDSSIASVAVAAHEVGHAIQDQENYAMMRIRGALVPAVNFSSNLVWGLIMMGLIFQMTRLIDLGIIFFCVTMLFQLVTLPVEFNASKRAMENLESGIITRDEAPAARSMLSAAAMTYVAAMLVSVLNLVRLLSLRNSRD